MRDDNCIFCKLANGVFPTNSIYEDDDFNVILDASPATKGHALILPKEHYANIYEIDEEKAFAECSVLRFNAPDEAWLDFVSANRAGSYSGEPYDFIYGPVANDDVYTTFTLYTAGVLTKEQTIEALKIKKLYNQLVLTSEKALKFLKYVGTVPEEEF